MVLVEDLKEMWLALGISQQIWLHLLTPAFRRGGIGRVSVGHSCPLLPMGDGTFAGEGPLRSPPLNPLRFLSSGLF